MARFINVLHDRIVNGASFPGVSSSGTISIWIKPNFNSGDSLDHVFWTAGGGGGGADLPGYRKFSDNNIYCGFNGGGQADQRIVIADTGLFTSGTWANWVFTWSAGAGQTLYKNAVSKGTHSLTFPTIGSNFALGDYFNSSASNACASTLADFAIWTVILSASELSALTNGARPHIVRPLSLLAFLPLDGIESPETDLSGNKYNGTLTGTSIGFGPPFMQFTPRWPQIFPNVTAAASSFQPAWAMRNRIVVEGIGI